MTCDATWGFLERLGAVAGASVRDADKDVKKKKNIEDDETGAVRYNSRPITRASIELLEAPTT